ncbi:MAG: NAD(P)H-dependent oxidoreductase [Armatimonadetes bacterium]|nr:NAD(P)H-dependent oxidoreductase [Armatimonadota bacterium]
MSDAVRILGIPGSLRRDSFNKAALRAAAELAPEGVTLEIFELDGIPLFNQDEEQNPAPRVVEFKQAIEAADAILFVTPEYNYSVPGVLKNAIDQASRPYGESAWWGKPAAVMGATVGGFGTGRAQYHLRQICVFLNIHLLNQPEVMLSGAPNGFDEQGNLTDQKSREKIRGLLEALAAWARQLKAAGVD